MTVAAARDNWHPAVRWGGLLGMVGGAAWILKVLYIVVALEPEEHDLVTTALYVAGFVLPLGAAVGVAAWVAGDSGVLKRTATYLAVVMLHVFTVTTLSEGIEALVDPLLSDSSHLVPEVPVALIGVIWFVLGYRMWSGRREAKMV